MEASLLRYFDDADDDEKHDGPFVKVREVVSGFVLCRVQCSFGGLVMVVVLRIIRVGTQ